MGTYGSSLATSSFSFWIKTTSATIGYVIGFRNNTTNQLFYLGLNSTHTGSEETGKISMTIRDASANLLQGAMTTAESGWRDGNWHFITVTVDGANDALVITIDNVSKAITYNVQETPTNFSNLVTYDVAIGSRNDNGTPAQWLTGSVDELLFWDKILTTQDKTDLWNSGDGLAYPFAVGTNMKINIGDNFKDIDALKINIGDTWKDVIAIKQNIGDIWKDVF